MKVEKPTKIHIIKLNLHMRKRFAKLQLFKNRQFYSCIKLLKSTKENKIKIFYFIILYI